MIFMGICVFIKYFLLLNLSSPVKHKIMYANFATYTNYPFQVFLVGTLFVLCLCSQASAYDPDLIGEPENTMQSSLVRQRLTRMIIKEIGFLGDTQRNSSIKCQMPENELALARKLLAENRYNKFTLLLNQSSMAVSGLFQGRLQPLFQLPIDLAYTLYRMNQSTPRERKSLFLLKQFFQKQPDSPEFEKWKKRISRLEQKKAKALFHQEYRFGRQFLEKDKLSRALFHFQNALVLDPSSKKAAKKIEEVLSVQAEAKRNRISSLFFLEGDDFFQDMKELGDYENLLYEALKHDQSLFLGQASAFLATHPGSHYCDDVEYTMALAAKSFEKRHDQIRAMQNIRKKNPGSNAAHRAMGMLHNYRFNPYARLNEAQNNHRKKVWKYILWGKRDAGDQVYLVSRTLPSLSMHGSFDNLGIMFFLDIGIRSMISLVSSPVSRNDLIDDFACFERSFVDDPQIPEIREKLTKWNAKQGEFSQALYYAEKQKDINPSKLKKLSDRQARKIYHLILQNPDKKKQLQYLNQLIAEHPKAPIVKNAHKMLDKLMEQTLYEFTISQNDLLLYPEIRKLVSQCLDPCLLDGNKDNDEITNQGLLFVEHGPTLYKTEARNSAQVLKLDAKTRKFLKIQAQTLGFRSQQDKSGGSKQEEETFPLEISGGVGSGGIEVYPSFLPIPYRGDDLALFR